MSGINVLNSAIKQIRSSQRNLSAIGMARRKLEQQDEMLDIKRKTAELQLKEKELSGELSGMRNDFLRSQIKEYFKQQQQITDGKLAMVNQAEDKEKLLSDRSFALAKSVIKSVPVFRNQAGLLEPVYNGGKLAGFKPREVKPYKEPKAEKPDYTTKDVIREARAMWKDAGAEDSGKTVDDFLDAAENRLAGYNENTSTTSPHRRKIRYTRKDVLEEARAMANNDGDDETPYIDKVKKYIPQVEDLFEGRSGGGSTKATKKEYSPAPNPRDSLSPVQKVLTSGLISALFGENTPRSSANNTNNDKVKVKAPDGRIGYIPKANLEEAKRRGAIVVK